MPDIGYSARSSLAAFSASSLDFPARSSVSTFNLSNTVGSVQRASAYYGYDVTLFADRATAYFGIDTTLFVAPGTPYYGIGVLLAALIATSKWTVTLNPEERRRLFMSFFD